MKTLTRNELKGITGGVGLPDCVPVTCNCGSCGSAIVWNGCYQEGDIDALEADFYAYGCDLEEDDSMTWCDRI